MAYHRQLLMREPVRCMYPDELLSCLQEFKHSRLASIGVLATRFGEQAREAVGLIPAGTIWVSEVRAEQSENGLFYDRCRRVGLDEAVEGDPEGERDIIYTIPKNCIPYTTISKSSFDEKAHRFTGETARGWRSLFSTMTSCGYFRPSSRLTWMIGEDSWLLTPRHLRI